ncbi:MAG TPA: hypothetical protein VGJ20_32245 [Xanthobacteraceae bacterium]|jgi:hypothetical protein
MRKIILVVASTVALGTATMTTSALAAHSATKVRPAAHFGTDLCRRYPGLAPTGTCRRFGLFAAAAGPWWVGTWWAGPWWYHEDCLDGLRWVLTPSGWSWQACVWLP